VALQFIAIGQGACKTEKKHMFSLLFLHDTVYPYLQVKRMVSGHTAQDSGKILTRCGSSYIGIDVGITAYYGELPCS